MDNSDDYFQDSFQLDDNDLALLAAEEAKYAERVSQAPSRAVESAPPRKRRKILHPQEPEDILDVFLKADGTYGVVVPMGQEDEEGNIPVPRNLLVSEPQDTAARPIHTNTLPDSHSSGSFARDTSPLVSNTRTPRTLAGQSIAPKVQYAGKLVIRRPHSPLRDPPAVPPNRTELRKDAEGFVSSHHQHEKEVAALKNTVEMLKLENEKVKKSLQDAEVARFAREGEVTILRNRVEKAAQQRAEDLVKLKETKEAASLEQARVQKEMKEQIERLRTQYIFKQHEIESSTRKRAWSSRSKRTALGSQMSPVPVPLAMRDWTSTHEFGSGRNNLFFDTPSRRRAAGPEKQDLNLPKAGARSRSANPELKFPGFENSFLPSSPSNSPSRSRQSAAARRNTYCLRTPQKGGKEKDMETGRRKNAILSPVKPPALTLRPAVEPTFDELPIDDTIQDFDGDFVMNTCSPQKQPISLRLESSPNRGQSGPDSVGDLDLSDDIDRDAPVEENSFIGIDWGEELHYMLFSHVSTMSTTLTFHFLLSANTLDQDYQQACSAILETLGSKYKFDTLRGLMTAVAGQLLLMASILWECEYFGHLRALFELLGSTLAYIPSFTSAVLQADPEERSRNATHMLFRVFCDIVLKSLVGETSKRDVQQSFLSLLESVLELLKIIAWTVSEAFCSSLMPLLQEDRVLLTLLDSSQPSTIISHTISTLVLLASHRPLAQSLLSSPREELRTRLAKTNASDVSQVPLIERLSGFLVDRGRLPDSNVDGDSSSILNFFALLMVANSEGRTLLLKSNAFIPCLIHFLTRLSATIWEDDAKAMQSIDCARSTVQNMKQALHLLHRLVLPSASSGDQGALEFDFRQKLFYVSHAMFDGLMHMFVVMIGRLSYADPPDWLGTELQLEVEGLTEPARDLMDLIIEGPEGDSVWVAYQDAEDESITENDDEAEARLLDAIDDE